MVPGANIACIDVPTAPQDARIAAAQAGDRGALESLLAEQLPRMRNLVRYLVRGDRHVDDIAQEALIAVARGLAGFRGDGSLDAWVNRIVVRTTFGYVNKVRRREARHVDGPDLHAVPHPDAPPDDYARRRELVQQLDELPADQRVALVMHHVLGMSVPEIADELSTPAETIRSRLRLGRQKLRSLQETTR